MDSRTEAVGRKRRRYRNPDTSLKRQKLDEDNIDSSTGTHSSDEQSSYNDDSDLDESSDSAGGDILQNSTYDTRAKRSTSDDQEPFDPFEQFTGSEAEIKSKLEEHAVQILEKGPKAADLSNMDLLLVGRLRKSKGAKQRTKAMLRYCATALVSNLTGLARYPSHSIAKCNRKAINEILPPSSHEVGFLLRYSSPQAAEEATRKIMSIPCLSEGQKISLQAYTPDELQIPVTEAEFLGQHLRGYFKRTMIQFALNKKSTYASKSAVKNDLNLSMPDRRGYETFGVDKAELPAEVTKTDGQDNETAEPVSKEQDRGSEKAYVINERESQTEGVSLGTQDSIENHDLNSSRTTENGTTDPNMDQSATAITGVRYKDLSLEEQELQTRYWGITSGEDFACCPICSQAGHMSATCPSRTCKHCGAFDAHFSATCPSRIKCSKCRERGHSVTECQSKLTRSVADGYDCDLCNGNHKEEDCSWIWRTFNPSLIAPEKLIKVKSLPISCYECGSNKHWGDDCLALPKAKAQSSTNDVFSAKFANQFLINPLPEPSNKAKGFSIRGRAHKPLPGDKDEADDPGEASNFFGRKVNASLPPRPKIQVNPARVQSNGFTPINAPRNETSRRRNYNYRSVPPPHEQQSYSRGIDQSRSRHAQGYHNAGYHG